MSRVLTWVGVLLFIAGALLCGNYIYEMQITPSFENMASIIWAAALPILYGLLGLLGAVLACAGLILDAIGKRDY